MLKTIITTSFNMHPKIEKFFHKDSHNWKFTGVVKYALITVCASYWFTYKCQSKEIYDHPASIRVTRGKYYSLKL